MKIWDNLKISSEQNILGRGKVLTIDLLGNDLVSEEWVDDVILRQNDCLLYKNEMYAIKGIEMSRNLLNGKISRFIVLVVKELAGSNAEDNLIEIKNDVRVTMFSQQKNITKEDEINREKHFQRKLWDALRWERDKRIEARFRLSDLYGWEMWHIYIDLDSYDPKERKNLYYDHGVNLWKRMRNGYLFLEKIFDKEKGKFQID